MVRYSLILLFFIFLPGCGQDNMPVSGLYPKEGLASWYVAKRTATGEIFKKNELTCAMRKRDFGKNYIVCNLENKKCVVVRHNNFGPSKRMFQKGRIIDLSKAAFSRIADLKQGLIKVRISQVASGEAILRNTGL